MKKLMLGLIFVVACKSQGRHPQLTKDSIEIAEHQTKIALTDAIKALDKVYEQEIELAQHAYDDSIRYYEGRLDIAIAGGKNYYVLSGFKRRILSYKALAADSALKIASVQAKREQDLVWDAQVKDKKRREIFLLQQKLDSGLISESSYSAEILKVNSRTEPSPVTLENAVKMSIEYNKHKYEQNLKDQQKILEKAVDSLTGK